MKALFLALLMALSFPALAQQQVSVSEQILRNTIGQCVGENAALAARVQALEAKLAEMMKAKEDQQPAK